MTKKQRPIGRKCYAWHYETMEFVGEGIAFLSPADWELGHEVYALPANATFSVPPHSIDGHVVLWRGGEWAQVPDKRGVYYDTQTRERHEIKCVGGVPGETWTVHEPFDRESVWGGDSWIIPFDMLKTRKIQKIRADADRELNEIQSNYSQSEVISWSKQEAGARELSQDVGAVSPDAAFVRAMALERGIGVQVLVEKIMQNLSPYAETMARVLGNQQRREDLVKNAGTVEELDVI